MKLSHACAWLMVFGVALCFAAVINAGGRGDAEASATVFYTGVKRVPFEGLIVPVARVGRDDLMDTWGAARSESRTHQGIDIMAPQGTPVLAAADGRIVKFHDSVRGGVSIYQFDREGRFVYYYAHLNARADDLREGAFVQQGDVIGFVGETGNASTPHLHFEVQRLTPEKRWYRAAALNPYPLLASGEEPR